MKKQSSILTSYYNSRLTKAQVGTETTMLCPEGFQWNEQRKVCTTPDGRTFEELKASNDANWYKVKLGLGTAAGLGAAYASRNHPLVSSIPTVIKEGAYKPYFQSAGLSLVEKASRPFAYLPIAKDYYKLAAEKIGSQSGNPDRSIASIIKTLKNFKSKKFGPYTGSGIEDYAFTSLYDDVKQNALRNYLYGDNTGFEESDVPYRNLGKYEKKYGTKFKTYKLLEDANYKGGKPISISSFYNGIFTSPKYAEKFKDLSYEDIPAALKKFIIENGSMSFGSESNPIGPSDIGGHMNYLDYDPATGKVMATTQDIWKFSPKEYGERWGSFGKQGFKEFLKDKPGLQKNLSYGVKSYLDRYNQLLQAKMMERAGTPFVQIDKRPVDFGIDKGKVFVPLNMDNIELTPEELEEINKQAGLAEDAAADADAINKGAIIKPATTTQPKKVETPKRLSAAQSLRQAVKNRAAVARPRTSAEAAPKTEVEIKGEAPKLSPRFNLPKTGKFLKGLLKEVGKKQEGGMITDPMGQWKYPGMNTRIPGEDITMEGVPYPVMAYPSNSDEPTLMQPGKNYSFPDAQYVDEYPIDLRLPKYEKPKPFVTGYGFSVRPVPNVDVHGVGLYGQGNVNDRLNLSGNVNSASVFYPGGNKMFMNPRFEVGMKYRFKDGGLTQYQTLGEVNEESKLTPEQELAAAKQEGDAWLQSWYNSPKYKEIMSEQLSPGEEWITEGRQKQMDDLNNITWKIDNKTRDAGYMTKGKKTGKHTLGLNLKGMNPQMNTPYVVHHELNHYLNGLGMFIPQKMKDFLNQIQPVDKKGEPSWMESPFYKTEVGPYIKTKKDLFGIPHVKNREEVEDIINNKNKTTEDWYSNKNYVNKKHKSDILSGFKNNFDYFNVQPNKYTENLSFWNDARYEAQKLGIYDPFTEEFTIDHYNKLMKEGSSKTANRFRTLKGWYTPENIVKGMNTFAKTESKQPQTMARYGGGLDQYQVAGETTYTHERGTGGLNYSPVRTVSPYLSNRDIRRYTQAPTSGKDVNFIANYGDFKRSFGKAPQDYNPTSVPYEGSNHWNINRFIVDPHLNDAFGDLNVNASTPEERRASILADMYKYNMLQDPKHKGRAFRQAKRFVRREIDPMMNGAFLNDFLLNQKGTPNFGLMDPLNTFDEQNPLLSLNQWNRGVTEEEDMKKQHIDYNPAEWTSDRVKNISMDYLRNYKKMSRRDARKQWNQWEQDAAAYEGTRKYQMANPGPQRTKTIPKEWANLSDEDLFYKMQDLPEDKETGWNIDYKDATGKGTTKHFATNREAEQFYNTTPGEKTKYSDVSSYIHKYGGGLLSRTVTCSNCGWSWKGVEGGEDVMTCHKCGGTAKLAKAQNGFSFLPEQDPEMMYTDRFNTSLNEEESNAFNDWVAEESKRQGRDIMMDKGAYDIQGFWKSGDYKKMDQDNHGTDTWKKPNHPTFSNQSKYHGVDGFYGGNWTNEAGYQPSKQTASTYGPSYYSRLFAEEPNRPEHLDASRFMSGTNRPSPLYYKNGGPGPKKPFFPVSNFSEPKYVAGQNPEGHYGYSDNTVWYDPNSEVENVNNPWWLGHEQYHHYQTLTGNNPKERRGQEVDDEVNRMIQNNPGLQFIPKSKLITGSIPDQKGRKSFVGAEDRIYEDPSTVEGAARLYEQYIDNGGKSIFPKPNLNSTNNYPTESAPLRQGMRFKQGGVASNQGYYNVGMGVPRFDDGGNIECPPGEYYNVTAGRCLPLKATNLQLNEIRDDGTTVRIEQTPQEKRLALGMDDNMPPYESLGTGTEWSDDFLKNWYKGRVNDPRYGKVAQRRIAEIPKIKEVSTTSTDLKKKKAAAYYMPGTKNIYIDPNNVYSRGSSTQSHEKLHELYDQVPQPNQDQIIKNLIIPQKNWKNTSSSPSNFGYGYYSDPTEVAARLIQFRKRYNIDPSKKYTREQMKAIIDAHRNRYSKGVPYSQVLEDDQSGDMNIDELLDIIGDNPDKLAQLNDQIVSNQKSIGADVARFGGDIPKYQKAGQVSLADQLRQSVKKRMSGQRMKSFTDNPVDYIGNVISYNKERVGDFLNDAGETVSDYVEGAKKYVSLMKDEDEKNIQETNKDKIFKQPTDTKSDVVFGYNEYGEVPDVDGKRKFAKFTYTFDNDSGARYVLGNKVKEVTEGGAKKHFTNVKAVAHFLRDSDILPNQKFAPNEWEVHGGNKFISTSPGRAMTSIGFDRPDWYRTLYKPNPSKPGEYLVKYVKNKEIDKKAEEKLKNEGWALDFTVSGQSKFSDVDWEGEGPSTKYAAKSKWLPLKNGDHINIPYKDKKGFSRFSGGSITYLFNEPKTGKRIGVDISGSVSDMKAAGESLIQKYKLKPEQLEFVFHDMGSYSAKPKADKNNELDYDQWIDFNSYNRGFSGAPLMIPKEKYGGDISIPQLPNHNSPLLQFYYNRGGSIK